MAIKKLRKMNRKMTYKKGLSCSNQCFKLPSAQKNIKTGYLIFWCGCMIIKLMMLTLVVFLSILISGSWIIMIILKKKQVFLREQAGHLKHWAQILLTLSLILLTTCTGLPKEMVKPMFDISMKSMTSISDIIIL